MSPLRELRSSLSELRLNDLAVGKDGRNRTILSAFRSRTGRNQPSNTRFIFGPSVWLRGLDQTAAGHGVAYVDWSQQEFGIAAALSGDAAMQAAYKSGDPYLAFAKQAAPCRRTPQEITRPQRELFKQCVLAAQYGQGEDGLAQRIGQPRAVARDLLRAHRETYRTFWRWSDAAVDAAMLTGSLHTVFGWHVHTGENPNPRSLRNFPMQANGAEMMRLAACLATERGIEVCAPVHDAFLICAPLDRIGQDIAAMRAAMAEASRTVLNGFEVAGWSRGEDRMSHNVPNDMKDLVLTEAEVAAAMKAASEGSTPRKLRNSVKIQVHHVPGGMAVSVGAGEGRWLHLSGCTLPAVGSLAISKQSGEAHQCGYERTRCKPVEQTSRLEATGRSRIDLGRATNSEVAKRDRQVHGLNCCTEPHDLLHRTTYGAGVQNIYLSKSRSL